MGVDTYGIIAKDIKVEDVFQYIKYKYDTQAILTDGFKCNTIYFNYNKIEERQLWIFKNTDKTFTLEGFGELTVSEGRNTTFDLGYWGHSVEIINDLVSHFGGGFVDFNDCDDISYEIVKGKEVE